MQYTQASPTYAYGPAAAHAHCFDQPPPYVNEEAAVFSQKFPMPPPTIAPMSQVRHKTITLRLTLYYVAQFKAMGFKEGSRLLESCVMNRNIVHGVKL